MEKRHLFAVCFAGLVVGCTSLLGDFEVSATGGSGVDAGQSCTGPDCPCTGTQVKCGGVCVDTTTDAKNCGQCGKACGDGLVCEASACKCGNGGNLCGGTCASRTDRSKCGAACAPCQNDEICDTTCKPAPAPEFAKEPLAPAGWQDPGGNPFTIEIKPTGIPGTIYECRTGPAGIFTPTVPEWKPCDGGPGTGTAHRPTPDATTPEGTYRTEYRYRVDTYRSPTIAARLYMHHSLDKVAMCPRPNRPADGPHFSDQEIFAAVLQWANTQNGAFPVAGIFPQGSNPPDRNDPIHLLNPWIRIPFAGVAPPRGGGWAPMTDYVLNERSLRHRYVVNQLRNLVLVKRTYVSPRTNDCQNRFKIGNEKAGLFGPTGRGVRYVDCEAFVLNTHGNAVCVNSSGGPNAKPIIVPIDRRPLPDQPGTGTLAAVKGSDVVTSNNYQFTLAGWSNSYIYIVDPDPNPYFPSGRWYQIKQVASPTKIVLTEPYQRPGGGALGWRYRYGALFEDFDIPTGYPKLHQDGGHFYATGMAGAYPPSKQTKCETKGCTGPSTPWLTYLPP